ncbi:membrane protein [Pontibacillus halophilus JSM 076056 = DSM 19796]|uniref:Membrane protein n=1 Tax=Pontibacillus halophilus JSM 076056 = DSM 19796 TaxID=1385510 RepID=A0A0A5GDK3_9BACI|nr:exopolysaccharide Pel transporter PelG [Pontibacillus halophilus]KGX89293.1 membrane protein [Pontibacillus halophilus JSM 076056 = DSM 19796]
MAGIGFKLQKLFQEDYFSSRMKAYAFAGLVTSGPWLTVIITIGLIQWITSSLTFIEQEERELFNLSVSYCFIFSQVILGVQQLIVTRYVADLFYEKRTNEVFATFIGMSKVTIAIAVALFGVFLFFSPLSLLYEFVLLMLFITINLIWVLFLFLSAAKYYQAVAYSFLIGAFVSVGLVFLFAQLVDVWGIPSSLLLLIGFTIGMVVTLFGLFLSMLLTFPYRGIQFQFSYFHYFDRFPSLFWTGFLYNAGIWVCNWVIWFGEGRSFVADTFVYNRVYDTAIFWSYLTIVPTLILFVVSVETRFYERYRVFYGYINEGGTLNQIKRSKGSMQLVLKQELERLIRSQGVFSLFMVVTAGYWLSLLSLDAIIVSIFRITTVGTFSNAMVLVLTLILLYFEDRRGAMYTSILFFTFNLGLSIWWLPLGLDGYGLGFTVGSSLAFLFAVVRLIRFIEHVDYHAFCRPHDWVSTPTERFTKVGRWLNTRAH